MKRSLALLLAFILTFSLVPTSAFAAGWVQLGTSISDAVKAGTSITTARMIGDLTPIYSNRGTNVATRMAKYYFDSAEKGYAYCSEHLKNVPTDGSQYALENVSLSNDKLSQGILVGGYPMKTMAYYKDLKRSTIDQYKRELPSEYRFIAHESESANSRTPLSSNNSDSTDIFTTDEWNDLVAAIPTMDDDDLQAATQLAIWHATDGLLIEGAICRDDWAPHTQTINAAFQKTHKYKTMSAADRNTAYATVLMARFLLLQAARWTAPASYYGGTFLGEAAENGESAIQDALAYQTSWSGNVDSEFQNYFSRDGEWDWINSLKLTDEPMDTFDKESMSDTTYNASDGSIYWLYENAKSKNTDHLVCQQKLKLGGGKEETYYVVYFNIYTDAASTGNATKVTITGLNNANANTNGFLGVANKTHNIAVVAVEDIYSEPFADSTTTTQQINSKYIFWDDCTKTAAELPKPVQVFENNTAPGNWPFGLGEHGKSADNEGDGNGYRYFYTFKLCIPTWLYNFKRYEAMYKNYVDDCKTFLQSNDPTAVAPNIDDYAQGCKFSYTGATYSSTWPNSTGTIKAGTSAYPGLPGIDLTFQLDVDSTNYDMYEGQAVRDDYQNVYMADVTRNVGGIMRITLGGYYFKPVSTDRELEVNPTSSVVYKYDVETNKPIKGAQFYFTGQGNPSDWPADSDGATYIECQNDHRTVITTDASGYGIWNLEADTVWECKELPSDPPGEGEEPAAPEYEWVEKGTTACTHLITVTEKSVPSPYLAQSKTTWVFTPVQNRTSVNGVLQTQGYERIPNASTPESGDVTIRKVDADTGDLVYGATFFIKNISTGKEWYKTATNGTVVIKYGEDGFGYGDYYVTESSAPNGYEDYTGQPQTFSFSQTSGNQKYELEFANYRKHDIIIKKLDADSGEPIANVTFKYTYNGQTKTAKTDKNGLITISAVDSGTYVIQEIKTASGYALNTEPQTITVDNTQRTDDATGYTHYVTFTNHKLHDLVIQKLDADTGSPVYGAHYKYTYNGQTRDAGTTNASGKIVLTDVQDGQYTIWEDVAAEGYALDSTPKTIMVNSNTKTNYGNGYQDLIQFTNHKLHEIQIVKVDYDNSNKKLNGATFKWYFNNEYKGTITTAYDGTALLEDCGTGTYKFEEVTPPDGYMLPENSADRIKSVYVDTDKMVDGGYTHTLTFTNHRVKTLVVEKRDADTGALLRGASFRITSLQLTDINQTYDEVHYNETGVLTLSDLPAGNYVITEVNAPLGYEIDPDPQYFTISEQIDNEDRVVKTFNDHKQHQLIITKLDAENDWDLAGAEFNIKSSDGSVNRNVTTGTDGTVEVPNLPYGTYTITETKAPQGYAVAEPKTVVLSKLTTADVIEDEPLPALFVRKVDGETQLLS